MPAPGDQQTRECLCSRTIEHVSTAAQPITFLKGHGTENDFVIIPDPEGRLELTEAAVAALCDRRAGLGGDGLLRIVRSVAHPEARGMAEAAEWFMDYRNSDGSIAEMCGNGVRVFAHCLERMALAKTGELAVATRAGVRHVRLEESGAITVSMGRALFPGPDVSVRVGDRSWSARHVSMGNPHAVAFVDDLDHAGSLAHAPEVTPTDAYPSGVNVEFVVDRGVRHVEMRVHERGSGETRSCGTGACAVMVAAARRDGADPVRDGQPVTYTVDVPGGRLVITERVDGEVEMTGPAVVVAEGIIDPALLVGV